MGKKDRIIKSAIAGVIVVGFVGMTLSLVDNKENINEIMNRPVTIMNQMEYNVFLQRKITPVIEMSYDIIGMRKIYTEINYLNYQKKIDNTIETIDSAIIDLAEQDLTPNQFTSNERTIATLGTLKVHLGSLKGRLGEANEMTGLFDFHHDSTLESIFTDIQTTLTNLDDYLGLGEEVRP